MIHEKPIGKHLKSRVRGTMAAKMQKLHLAPSLVGAQYSRETYENSACPPAAMTKTIPETSMASFMEKLMANMV